MAITPVFMADPPQFLRTKTQNASDGVSCVLGDRWSVNVTGVTYTYKCTTAGTPSGGFSATGSTPYNWGTSVWEVVTPSSWANAATRPYKDSLHYVDCNSRFPFNWACVYFAGDLPPRAVIYVEPSTMRPRNGWSMPLSDPDFNYTDPSHRGLAGDDKGVTFFGGFNATNFHGRKRLGDIWSISGFMSSGYPARVDVDAEFTTGDASTLGYGSRGVRIRTGNTAGIALPTHGVAVTLTAPSTAVAAASVAAAAVERDDAHVFGLHTNHPLSGVLNATYTPSGITSLYRTAPAYMSDNSNPPLRSVLGSSCALNVTTGTYRNGAASGGDEAFSFLVGGHKFASVGAMWLFPFLYLQNTLTGSRTVTMHFLTDSPHEGDITNVDIWLDCFYPSSNTTPKYSLVSSEHANWGVPGVRGTAVTLDTGQTWTSPTIYYPTAFKISVTMTIQKAGMLLLRPVLTGRRLSQYVLFMCPYVDVA